MNAPELEHLAHRHLQQGYEYQRAGYLGFAMQEYRLSLALAPSAEAHTFLGALFQLLGYYEEAIEQCKRAIALDPDFGNSYHDLGNCLIKLGRWNEAGLWFELALNAPRYKMPYQAHYHLGRVHEYFGRYEEALACYKKAQTTNEVRFPPALHAMWNLIGRMN